MKQSVEKIWAFVSDEGICALKMPGAWLPMVCATEKRANEWKAHAQTIANLSGRKIAMLEFSNGEQRAEFLPEVKNET